MKPEGQDPEFIIWRSLLFRYGTNSQPESGNDVGNYSTFCGVRIWSILAEVIARAGIKLEIL